jgi:hypothetical protein
MGILEITAVLSLLFAGAIFVAHSKYKDRAMAVLIGVSAGLVGVQVLRVHVFTILVVLWFVMPNGNTNRGSGKRIYALGASSLLLAVTTLFGDLVVSPTLGLQLLALTTSACMIIARSTELDRKDMLFGLLAVITVSSTLGLLQVAKIAPIEIWHVHVSSVGRPIGIYPEPDYLGLFSGLGLILAWRMPLPPLLRTSCISVTGAAFVLAFARAAWIGVAASVALVVVLSLIRAKNPSPPKAAGRGKWPAVLLLSAAGIAFLTVNQSFAADFVRRLEGTISVGSNDISGQARVRQFDALLHMASTAPWYGHGLSANGRVGIWGGFNSGDAADTSNAVGTNWLLSLWVDGKLMALPLIVLLIVVALVAGRTLAGQMLVVVLLNNLFSNTTFSPITWLLVGLAFSSALDGMNQDTRRPARLTAAPTAGLSAMVETEPFRRRHNGSVSIVTDTGDDTPNK